MLGMGPGGRAFRGLVAVLIIAASIQSYGSNFFFYFTILSNLLAVVLLTGQALWPNWMRSNAFFRGAVTVYMTMTGLVYAVVLAPLAVDVGDWAGVVTYGVVILAIFGAFGWFFRWWADKRGIIPETVT